jgi:hypothetical protein
MITIPAQLEIVEFVYSTLKMRLCTKHITKADFVYSTLCKYNLVCNTLHWTKTIISNPGDTAKKTICPPCWPHMSSSSSPPSLHRHSSSAIIFSFLPSPSSCRMCCCYAPAGRLELLHTAFSCTLPPSPDLRSLLSGASCHEPCRPSSLSLTVASCTNCLHMPHRESRLRRPRQALLSSVLGELAHAHSCLRPHASLRAIHSSCLLLRAGLYVLAQATLQIGREKCSRDERKAGRME